MVGISSLDAKHLALKCEHRQLQKNCRPSVDFSVDFLGLRDPSNGLQHTGELRLTLFCIKNSYFHSLLQLRYRSKKLQYRERYLEEAPIRRSLPHPTYIEVKTSISNLKSKTSILGTIFGGGSNQTLFDRRYRRFFFYIGYDIEATKSISVNRS